MLSDIEISKRIDLLPIEEVAKRNGINTKFLEKYGEYKAKINLDFFEELKDREEGKLILVSAITPTPAGEGKTTVSIGLSLGLNRIGKKSIVTLREPSMGPLFGIKGGATGGGYSQVLPMEDINLHFTGDIHAVSAAHNLISAMVDNHIHRRKEPMLDPRTVLWPRVVDMNDRALREIIIALGGKKNGCPRETGFYITAASEIMAILGLATSYKDLKDRISNILLGFTFDNEPVYLKDLAFEGAVAALLRDALKPNLVQTTENTPAFVHAGPFANIAQGTCSVISMKMALKLFDYVVTEAGFGFDLGAEKFFDIVARSAGLNPVGVVLVATVRALKMHGGMSKKELTVPSPKHVEKGLSNLEKHLENILKFNVPSIVAINRFLQDTDEEIEVIKRFVESKNGNVAVITAHSEGSKGAVELAEKVVEVSDHTNHYKPLYPLHIGLEKKIEIVTSEIYGSKAVDFTSQAKKDIKRIKKLGLDKLPVCIAKTQKSLSDNPKLLGRPKDFLVTVRSINISSGAGFLVPITGDIMLMPGLPSEPAALQIDIDEKGNIKGLF